MDSDDAAVAAYLNYPEAPLGYTRRMDEKGNMIYPNNKEGNNHGR